jgi:hypothetical protein
MSFKHYLNIMNFIYIYIYICVCVCVCGTFYEMIDVFRVACKVHVV